MSGHLEIHMRICALFLFPLVVGCTSGDLDINPKQSPVLESGADAKSAPPPCDDPTLVMSSTGPSSGDVVCGADIELMSVVYDDMTASGMDVTSGDYMVTIGGAYPENVVTSGWLQADDGTIIAGPEAVHGRRLRFTDVLPSLEEESGYSLSTHLVVSTAVGCGGEEPVFIEAAYLAGTTSAEYSESGDAVECLKPYRPIRGNRFTFAEGSCTVSAYSGRPEPGEMHAGEENLLDVFVVTCEGEGMTFTDFVLPVTGWETFASLSVGYWDEDGLPQTATAYPVDGEANFSLRMPAPVDYSILLPVYGVGATTGTTGTAARVDWSGEGAVFYGDTSGVAYDAAAITPFVLGVEHTWEP